MAAESYFVEFIPESKRKGRPISQFPLWFTVNMMVLTTSTGAIGVLAGLNLFWSVVAIVIGNMIGAIFVALHCVQGPRLGVPQMIQSRAQFGVFGAVIPLVFVTVMYVGYFAGNAMIGADAGVSGLGTSTWVGVVIITLIIFVINYYGHDLIHRVAQILSVALAIGFVIVTAVTLSRPFPTNALAASGTFDLQAFVLLIAGCATWQLTYAPYVADYSRYLPSNTSAVKVFLCCYGGLTTATIWLMSLGAALMTISPSFGEHPTASIAALFPSGYLVPISLFVVLGVIATNLMNMYGAVMSSTTIIDTVTPIRSTPTVRFVMFACVAIIEAAIAIFASDDFMAFFGGLLALLGYMMFPWTVINLTDFFFLRKEKYKVADLFDANGIYGKFGSPALLAYGITILCEIPFMSFLSYNSYFYVQFGGIDLAWVVALVVPGFIYYPLMKRQLARTNEIAMIGGLS